MPCTIPYFKAIAIAWDQLFNAHLRGWPDETLSSRAYRWRVKGVRNWPERWINRLFFWDRDKESGKRHCELSFETEREGRQLPPEARASAKLLSETAGKSEAVISMRLPKLLERIQLARTEDANELEPPEKAGLTFNRPPD